MKRKLETVTLLGIDCLNIERLALAMDICEAHFEFATSRILTSLPGTDKRIVPIDPINSTAAYSEFVIRDLERYVDTPHVLIVQYDGFILNPDAWSGEFLNYDYIGAPWLVREWSIEKFHFPQELFGKLVVGNGGFSLRSKRFLSVAAELARMGSFSYYHPEDVSLCIHHRNILESRGLQFGPVPLAEQFSFESRTDKKDAWDGQFGFHGLSWTDISNWLKIHPEYRLNREKNILEKI